MPFRAASDPAAYDLEYRWKRLTGTREKDLRARAAEAKQPEIIPSPYSGMPNFSVERGTLASMGHYSGITLGSIYDRILRKLRGEEDTQ